MKFESQSHDPRKMKWEFWMALSHIDVMVRELWAGTEFVKKQGSAEPIVKINSEPGAGSPGQIVVKGKHGTVIWMCGKTKRLSVTKGGEEFMERLRKGFPAWDIETDGAGITKGKMPQQVSQTLRSSWNKE